MARILIADDSAEIRQLVSAIVVEEGHKVVVAEMGEQRSISCIKTLRIS